MTTQGIAFAPPTESIMDRATMRGHTVAILVEAGFSTLEGWASEGTDWDSLFNMTCGDTGEVLRVHGYNCDVEVL